VEVTLTSLLYLVSFYWPYLTGALAIGLVSGWLSRARTKT
jgi:hypothetical protein